MDMDRLKPGPLALLMFLLGFLIGMVSLLPFMENHKTIIKNGCGYYHPQTGDFTWNKKES